jgi:uncharacterized protein YjdB
VYTCQTIKQRSVKLMSKRYVSFMGKLAIASLLLGMVPPGGGAAVSADPIPAGDLLSETFEAVTAGTQPTTGWSIPGAPDPVSPAPDPYWATATVESLPGESGKGLKLDKNGKSAASFSVTRSFSGVARSLLSYRVKANQTNAVIDLPTPQNSSGTNLVRMSLYNGNISIWKDSAWAAIQPYEAGKWYDIQLALNTTTKKADVYIDGELKVNQHTSAGSSTMAKLMLGVYKDSAGSAYFDDLNLYSYSQATGVSFSAAEFDVPKWEALTLTPQFSPANATFRSAVWLSSNPAVASVDAFGKVLGHETGTVTITATPIESVGPISALVHVVAPLYPEPSGDLLSERFDGLAEELPPASWIVPEPSAYVIPSPVPYVNEAVVAAVGAEGNQALKFSKNGKSELTDPIRKNITAVPKATYRYKIRAEQKTDVFNLPSPIGTSNSSTVYLAKMALFDGHISIWKNQVWVPVHPYEAGQWHDIQVAVDTVNKKYDLYVDGVLKAAQEPTTGSGQFTALEMGFFRDSIGTVYIDDLNIYSYREAVDASMASAEVDVPLNGTMPLPLTYTPWDATIRSASWTTSDSEVAAVDIAGRVTARSPGTATVTAAPYNGLPAVSVTVNVYDVPVQSLSLNTSAMTVPVGSRSTLLAAATPADTTDDEIVWSSGDEAVAVVDHYGEVTGISAGTTTITATARGGQVTASSNVTVVSRTVQRSFYVSPLGSDANAGTLQAPFLTLGKAQEAVRAHNAGMTGDIVVYLREGVYVLENTLELDDRDSGTNGYFVRYRSYPGEKATISGGSQVTGWQLADGERQIYKAFVGIGKQSRQLFVDGVRAVRARSAAGLTNPVKTNVGYVSDDVQLASFQYPEQLEFVYFQNWTNSRVGVASVDVDNGKAVISMKPQGWLAAANKASTSAELPAYYENALELLDEPGEWYLNRTDGYVYYKPREWDNMSTAVATLPTTEQLLTVTGRSLEEQARNIRFEELIFAYTTWLRPDTEAGHSDAQNNYLRYPGLPDYLPDAAVTVERANTIDFERNEFTKLGITALKLIGGVQNSTIRGNRFYDLSGGAVSVGVPNYRDAQVSNPTDSRLWMKNNDIVDNYIHDIGIDFQSASAVSAGFPLDMDISHNEMFNLPYSGIHLNYGWASPFPVITKNITIESNFIHDLMGRDVRDGGAIYVIGRTAGSEQHPNVVRDNYILNQYNDSGALYPDEGSSNWSFTDNVIDLRASQSWHNSAPKWAHVWRSSIHDLTFDGNYTTTALYRNEGVNTVFTNTYVQQNAIWPAPAEAVIAASGLTEAYRDIAGSFPNRLAAEPVSILTGATAQLEITAFDGKGAPVSTEGGQFYYRVIDPQIASADSNGIVTGIAKGHTKVETIMLANGIVYRTEADIWVGELLADIGAGHPGSTIQMTVGAGKALQVYGLTDLGRRLEPDSVQYMLSRSDIAAVDGAGNLSAIGEGSAAIVVRASWRGTTLERVYPIQIVAAGAQIDYPLSDELTYTAPWYLNATGTNNITVDSAGISVKTPAGHAVYQGKTYLNERLRFGLKLQGSSGWYGMMLRNQHPSQGFETGSNYLIVVKPDVLELHRFNGGQRTVIYGNLAGFVSAAGDAIPNTALPFNQTRHVEAGAFNEPGGVRIVLKIGEDEVINYLDTDAEALREPGYFGLYARSGAAELTKDSDAAYRLADLVLGGDRAMTVGSSGQTELLASGGDGSVHTVTYGAVYYSSNPLVASVSVTGVVYGLGQGETVISAAYGGMTAAYRLQVGPNGLMAAPIREAAGTDMSSTFLAASSRLLFVHGRYRLEN